MKTRHLKNAIEIVIAPHPLNLAVKKVLTWIHLLMVGKIKAAPS